MMTRWCVVAFCCVALFTSTVFGQDNLAEKLSNPLASLVSVPIQANTDHNIGPDDGSVLRINIQPVLPFSLSPEWNLISRTIFPVIDQDDVPSAGAGESGLGDIVQSLFFSPKAPTAGGLIWGVGPVLLLPSASDELLGAEQWGVGPTAVALKQTGPWTVGGLVNHIESVAGEDDRSDISATFVQPFVSYNTKTKTTLTVNLESTYDWETEEWAIPVNLMANQMLTVGSQIMQVGIGARYWLDSPDGAADEWGARLQVVFLYPK